MDDKLKDFFKDWVRLRPQLTKEENKAQKNYEGL